MGKSKWALVMVAACVLLAVMLAGCGEWPDPAGAIFWGSAKSDKYHYPSCQWAQRIYPGNKVVFRSTAQARAAGYVPCKVCQPPG